MHTVVNRQRFNADPDPTFYFVADPDYPIFFFDADPDPTFYFNAGLDPDPTLKLGQVNDKF